MNIKRYDLINSGDYNMSGHMEPHAEGDYVLYTDHIAALEAVKATEPVAWRKDYADEFHQFPPEFTDDAGLAEAWRKHPSGFTVTPLYSIVPSPALEANQQVIETLRAALELSREWIGILRGSCGDVSMQMGDDRDPSVLEEAVYSKIAAALSDNPKGESNAK